jgi:hypothetical protein
MTDLLEHPPIDWADFETAGEQTRAILSGLDEDRAALCELVEGAKGGSTDFSEDPGGVGITLYHAVDKGIHLRLHIFRDGGEERPHTHRHSFSTRILTGGYRHTWYGRTGDTNGSDSELTPYLTRMESPGSTYTLHHSGIHSIAPSPDTVALVLKATSSEEGSTQASGGSAAETYSALLADLNRLKVI